MGILRGRFFMRIRKLPFPFSICKVKDIGDVDFTSPCVFLSKTDDEVSVIAKDDCIPLDALECDSGWACYKLDDGILDFSLVGILSGILAILKDEGISILAVSTYNTDYFLVKEELCLKAENALKAHGYEFS